jgi:hypothetical protein
VSTCNDRSSANYNKEVIVKLSKFIESYVFGIGLIVVGEVGAAPLPQLPTAERVEQDLEQVFKQCIEEVLAVKPEGNQLISDGIASCHQQMAEQWLARQCWLPATI